MIVIKLFQITGAISSQVKINTFFVSYVTYIMLLDLTIVLSGKRKFIVELILFGTKTKVNFSLTILKRRTFSFSFIVLFLVFLVISVCVFL